MFVKKDHRKIEEVLLDDGDNREILKLSKRAPEFEGTIAKLCGDAAPFLHLRILNLYNNQLRDLEGIGILSNSPLKEINLGFNDLEVLPIEFRRLQSLEILWLDDNNFVTFPDCLSEISGLQSLRLQGNSIAVLPESVSGLQRLETFDLSNNEISKFPSVLSHLKSLKNLWLRQNYLTEIDVELLEWPCLEILSVSSNMLYQENLSLVSEKLSKFRSLKSVYVNGQKTKK